jgi:hypothetical protein
MAGMEIGEMPQRCPFANVAIVLQFFLGDGDG